MPMAKEFGEEPESCRINSPLPESAGGLTSLAAFDRFDLLAMAVVLLLVLAAVGLMVVQPGESGRTEKKNSTGRLNIAVASPEFASKMAIAANLLNGGDLASTSQLLDELIANFPYEAGPHMLKGDLLLRNQQAIAAMLEYRQGVDLNPDYLDKKMPEVFQGKKIKGNLEEARLAITAGLNRNPGDATLRQQREVLYYMLRKVAGSCG